MFKICNNEKIDMSIFNKINRLIKKKIHNNQYNNFLYEIFNYLYQFDIWYSHMDINISSKPLLFKIDILNELIKYLNNHYIKNKEVILKRLNDVYINKKITKYDRKFIIKNLEYTDIVNDFKEYIKNKYKIYHEHEMLYNKYSSLLHLIIISLTIDTVYEVNFFYENPNIEINNNNKIYLYGNEKIYNSYIDNIIWIKQLILRYSYFNYILKTKNTPKITSFFLIDFPKELYDCSKIGPAEINTGITNGIYINITRREEALKTLVHELIHFHNLDFRTIPDNLNNLLHDKFNHITNEGYNMKLNIFEAYTETIASIMNICFWYNINIYKYDNNKNFNIYIDYFINQFCNQLYYTFKQCNKLLKYFDCADIDKCNINQTTNTVSYFFIKCYIYYYIDDFFNCINLKSLKFIINKDSFNILYKIINKGLKNKKIYKYIIENRFHDDNNIKMTCITENIF